MSATSAWCAGPWKHSPIPNSAERDREADERRGRLSQAPVASTSSHATAQSSGISASARIRRRPSIKCEIGSCASTITAGVDREDEPDLALADPALVARELREEADAASSRPRRRGS